MDNKPNIPIKTRLTSEEAARIQREADEMERSVMWLLRKIILAHWDRQDGVKRPSLF